MPMSAHEKLPSGVGAGEGGGGGGEGGEVVGGVLGEGEREGGEVVGGLLEGDGVGPVSPQTWVSSPMPMQLHELLRCAQTPEPKSSSRQYCKQERAPSMPSSSQEGSSAWVERGTRRRLRARRSLMLWKGGGG